MPYSAVALAGAGVNSDLFPRIASSLAAVDVAALIRSKAAGTTNISWTALGAMPDAVKYGWGDIYTYEEGIANANNLAFPRSRRSVVAYPATGALSAANYTIPAASSVLVTPAYAEFGVEYANRNSGFVSSVVSFE